MHPFIIISSYWLWLWKWYSAIYRKLKFLWEICLLETDVSVDPQIWIRERCALSKVLCLSRSVAKVQISEHFSGSRTSGLCHARWALLRDSHPPPSTNKIYYTMTFREQEIINYYCALVNIVDLDFHCLN